MRSLLIAAGLAATLTGTAAASAASPSRDPAACLATFNAYDTAAWLYPNNHVNRGGASLLQNSALSLPMQRLRQQGCLTRSSDLDGMPALAAQLAPYRIIDSGPTIRGTAVHLGIVMSIYDEGRVTQFFRGLGYRSRGVGAVGLGRRLYIGPFATQGSLDQALETARKAGFIAPYAAQHTKF